MSVISDVFTGMAAFGALLGGAAAVLGVKNRTDLLAARDAAEAAKHAAQAARHQLQPSQPLSSERFVAGEAGGPTVADVIADQAAFMRAFVDHAHDGHGADHHQWIDDDREPRRRYPK